MSGRRVRALKLEFIKRQRPPREWRAFKRAAIAGAPPSPDPKVRRPDCARTYTPHVYEKGEQERLRIASEAAQLLHTKRRLEDRDRRWKKRERKLEREAKAVIGIVGPRLMERRSVPGLIP